ncbi:hypothetical protein ASG84_14550 [Rhodococcus sp. Leaf278]|uniref:hypothetical protein n=1 Tax=Rhodococcus sp. Leaf278 TaxID=1736319 RepID=UPI00070FDF16|nr:hypothetical protein [Rhodococcus sp. Leaf278]KQU58932.1 hypothetical protein ASG84_14550 [Rhodococcus sp. Leaf278]
MTASGRLAGHLSQFSLFGAPWRLQKFMCCRPVGSVFSAATGLQAVIDAGVWNGMSRAEASDNDR